MKAIITGDIIASGSISRPEIWLNPVKKLLSRFGNNPGDWEIFRGDSFQIKCEPADALHVALLLKSVIKKQKKGLDVRLAVAIGGTGTSQKPVSESTGEAFIWSGTLLDELKKKNIEMAVKTIWPRFDREMNLILSLASVIIDSWSKNTAESAELLLMHRGITQTELASRLGIAQSSVNERIKRGAIYKILELENYFRERVAGLLNKENV